MFCPMIQRTKSISQWQTHEKPEPYRHGGPSAALQGLPPLPIRWFKGDVPLFGLKKISFECCSSSSTQ
jgi:hypothetical protein